MYLKKNDLVLKSAQIEDAKILTGWWNDGKVMAHAGFPKGLGLEQEATIRNIKKMNQDVQKEQLLMILYQDVSIGEMHYKIDQNGANIGIKICDFSYHQKGIGTLAIQCLNEYLFDHLGVKRVYLDTNIHNIAAQKTYEKIGFNKIGMRKDVFIDQLGQPQSCYDYELTKLKIK